MLVRALIGIYIWRIRTCSICPYVIGQIQLRCGKVCNDISSAIIKQLMGVWKQIPTGVSLPAVIKNTHP